MAIPERLWTIVKSLLPAKTLALGYPELWFGEEKDAYKLFESKGSSLTVVDHKKYDGREVIADLNYPQDLGKFKLVIDHGTLEHCANIGQALRNAVEAVEMFGYIMHVSPVTMVNHGYFNFSPIFFPDFYRLNGFIVRYIAGLNKDHEKIPLGMTHKFAEFQQNMMALVIAERVEEKPFQWPIQGAYK